jgi:hypothetical protein
VRNFLFESFTQVVHLKAVIGHPIHGFPVLRVRFLLPYNISLASRTVSQSKGVVYMEYEGSDHPPRLLAEDLEATVDKRKLMEAAIPFYFPQISEDSIKPVFGCNECF